MGRPQKEEREKTGEETEKTGVGEKAKEEDTSEMTGKEETKKTRDRRRPTTTLRTVAIITIIIKLSL